MKQLQLFLFLGCCSLLTLKCKSQDLQLSLSPSQLLFFRNTELVLSTSINKWRVGVLGAYTPARQKEGSIPSAGDGLFGGYGNPHFHKVFRLWSVGLYGQRELGKNFFAATELAFRNWNFKKKQVSYDNVEGYSFNGLRTDNIDVWIAKFFIGLELYADKRFYMDVRMGFAVRNQNKTYLTHNETSPDEILQRESSNYVWGTPQGDIRIGFKILGEKKKTD